MPWNAAAVVKIQGRVWLGASVRVGCDEEKERVASGELGDATTGDGDGRR